MKTRLLVIIGLLVVAVSTVSLSLVYNQEIILSTGMMKSDEKPEPQQIIADPLCFVTDTATSGENGSAISLEKCYPLSDLENLGCDKPILSHLARYSNLLDEKFDGTSMIDLIGLPDGVSKEKFEECIDAIYQLRTSLHFEKLLMENQIGSPKDLVVQWAIATDGDPVCGIAVDNSDKLHWFAVDSFSNPRKMTVFQENPQPCKANTASCFCNVYMEFMALTTKELTFFTLEEEQKYSDVLIDYLAEENINRTPKFLIGKLNVNYTDSAVGYCGQMWGKNTYGFFSGAIVNDIVVDYGIDRELPLLCAISDDAKWQERK